VDRQPVRDRSDRLADLFLNPTSGTRDQARRIAFESARYNIGNIERTINVPLLPLLFLAPEHRHAMKFKHLDPADRAHAGASVPEGLPSSPHFTARAEMWTIEFRERNDDTIIRTTRHRDLPASGRFWIDPDTGRVLMAELIANTRDVEARMAVSFQSEPFLGMLVPIEMSERYSARGTLIEGVASYGNFRRFRVDVDDRFVPIGRPK
jgi:hypothetical protein